MKLLEKLSTYRCARCKKKISNTEFVFIGNHRFCLDCEKPKVPKPVVKHAKPIISFSNVQCAMSEQQESYSRKCKRCKTKLADDNYQYIDDYCFCLNCAQLPHGWELDKHKDRFKFHYHVISMHKEDEYWDNAINKADNRRSQNDNIIMPKNVQCLEIIPIRTKEDYEYPTEADFDQNTNLWVYTNEERSLWYFELRENYLSGWDGAPVYRGGAVTKSEVAEYLNRIGNHNYDYLLQK